MSVNILSPLAIWGNFYTETPSRARTVIQKTAGDVLLTYVKIQGRETKNGRVEIMGLVAKRESYKNGPAVLVASNPESVISEEFAIRLAEEGYLVLSVDLGGKTEEGKLFTVYPDCISYANYLESKDKLTSVKENVKNTCWYEWGAALFYAYEYLREQNRSAKIGAIGIKAGANAVWQLSSVKEDLSATAIIMNAGWTAYKGVYKFAGVEEPEFSDEVCAYVAGVDAQSYASHVKSPTLILSALTDSEYDPDRAHDTSSRIPESVYSAIDYSVGYSSGVGASAYKNLLIFFENFVKKPRKTFIKEPKLTISSENGELIISASADGKNLSEIRVYVSEEIQKPADRTWESAKQVSDSNKEAIFKYKPYANSGSVLVFAKAIYQNGFEISSGIYYKKLNAQEFLPANKNKIIFSTRDEHSESIFVSSLEKEIDFLGVSAPVIKKGPMDIEGAYSPLSLVTKKIIREKNALPEDSMLIMDFYSPNPSILNVKLTVKTEFGLIPYTATIKCNGGNVWHSVRIEQNKFKTEEGRILKSYENLYSLEIKAEGEYLVNNVLWV